MIKIFEILFIIFAIIFLFLIPKNPISKLVDFVKYKIHTEKIEFTMNMGTFVDIVNNKELCGTWVDTRFYNNNEKMIYVAQIDEDTITLYVLQNELTEKTFTYTGSFETNFDISKSKIIKSINYKNLTDDIQNASHRDEREFKFENGLIVFKGESLGDYSDVKLKKWSVNCFYTFKLVGERNSYYNTSHNNKIDFANFHFEYPYYYDIEDERSNSENVSLKSSDKTVYSSLTFRKKEISKIWNYEALYYNSFEDEYEEENGEQNLIYTNNFLISNNEAIMNVYFKSFGVMYNTSIMDAKNLEIINITMCYDYKDMSKYNYVEDYKKILKNCVTINK